MDTPKVVPISQAAVPAKKHRWLPVLTVLFLISYGLMTALIVQQGKTIESQRILIRELYRDASELQASRLKAQQDKVAEAQRHTQAPTTPAPANQNPSSQSSSQYPSTQAPAKQTPSSQAAQHQALKQTQKEPQFEMPSKPGTDLIDADRSLITI